MASMLLIGGKFPKKRSPMPPLIGIKAEPQEKGGDPMERGGSPTAPPKGISARNNAQEKPADEKAFHEQGAAPVATPESVSYRTQAQTCDNCEYMQGDQCSFLQRPVSAGDGCNRFEDKGEDEQVEHDTGGMDLEGAGDTERY